MIRLLTTRQLAADIVVGITFTLASLALGTPDSLAGTWPVIISLLICVGFGAAVAVRRLFPELALGLAWFAAIVQMTAGRTPAVCDLAVFAVLYAVAAYGTRLGYWLGFASAIVGAFTITAYLMRLSGTADFSWGTITIGGALLVAALFALLLSWTVGALVRSTRRARATRAAQQRAEAEAAVEQERVRIARDMHDVVAHSLAVVIAQADGARYAAASDPDAAQRALGTISTTARVALADVRVLLTQLRHSQGDGPQPTIADLDGLYAQVRAAGLKLVVTVQDAPPPELPAALQVAVYRILQEALTNALRHGGGAAAEVLLRWTDGGVLHLAVSNATTSDAPSAGHGVLGMRERAHLVGGELRTEVSAGRFVVTADLPFALAAPVFTPTLSPVPAPGPVPVLPVPAPVAAPAVAPSAPAPSPEPADAPSASAT